VQKARSLASLLVQQTDPTLNPIPSARRSLRVFSHMRWNTSILFASVLCAGTCLSAQELRTAGRPADAPDPAPPPTDSERSVLLDRVIANQKRDDIAQFTYERLERQELRKGFGGTQPLEVKITRAVPAGTGVDRIPVGPDGKPQDANVYRAELEKLERSLEWAAEEGRAQREAYDKIAKKQKERSDLIDATRNAFIYTFVDREPRGDSILTKYRMEPNPAYKATSRMTAVFAKVHGYIWIDEEAAQLARVEVQVIEDISLGGFLAKIYKGSHLVQERYEIAPGIWMPTYAQYDFDGRKFFISFGVHERTFYSQYRRIGPPKEALESIRAELGKTDSARADP
jgi:hypothetical protein